MVLVCASALGIYRLTGGLGIFHVAAVTGFLTLAGGIAPIFVAHWKKFRAVHPWFMYYSVLGLYTAAFFGAECPDSGPAVLRDGRDSHRRRFPDRDHFYSQKRESVVEVFRLTK